MSHRSILCGVLWLMAMVGATRADEQGASREYLVKAAMIFNFTQFVEWPRESFASDESPLVIGVVGANPFGDALDRAVAGKTAGGRQLAVKYFPSAASIDGCHVLYVPRSEDPNLRSILDALAGKPVLTVGETDSFLWAGGIIRFYTEDNKVRFEIHTAAAEKSRLTISAKLLKLARIFKAR